MSCWMGIAPSGLFSHFCRCRVTELIRGDDEQETRTTNNRGELLAVVLKEKMFPLIFLSFHFTLLLSIVSIHERIETSERSDLIKVNVLHP